MKKVLRALLMIVISAFLAYEAVTFVRVLPPQPKASVVVFIKPNSTVRSIAQQLKENQIISSPWKFRLLARARRVERILKPGEYRFDAPSSPQEAIQILVE